MIEIILLFSALVGIPLTAIWLSYREPNQITEQSRSNQE